MSYQEFLQRKKVTAPAHGFQVGRDAVNAKLFEFQRAAVAWAVRRGRAALFEECGLGKTFQQLDWSRLIIEEEKRPSLILAPLAVSAQTVAEGERLNIEVTTCRTQEDVKPGINITNYEMVEHFDPSQFCAIVLDESSILKSFMGKTKRYLVDAFANTPYRLCCSATPAPNDHMEIGSHSEFLGVMPSAEMISRWFINDTMHMGGYRLKGHAENDFWDWVASWAVSLRTPSDIGFSDDGYVLQPLNLHHHTVEVDETADTDGLLFRAPTISATTLHKEMRLTCQDRSHFTADMVNNSSEAWVVWCNTNYEADALKALIPDAIEVRGSDTIRDKERRLTAFSNGQERVIITKPSIAGFGLNWQHCHNAAFVGLSFSFELFYQAMRRIYRFGQKSPVHIHVVTAKTEGAILQSLQEKIRQHEAMFSGMSRSRLQLDERGDLVLASGAGDKAMQLPSWLQAA